MTLILFKLILNVALIVAVAIQESHRSNAQVNTASDTSSKSQNKIT
ncbi:hypothetical protein FHU15_005332 [Clostridium beijerinckii]|nr:hypothetical protein [Clostridium beijerinckii]